MAGKPAAYTAWRRDVYYLRCAPGRQRGGLVAIALVGFGMTKRDGAWMGHDKSAKVAKYCKQRMLIAISSH